MRKLILLLLLAVSLDIYSQEKMTYESVNDATYNFYLKKNWNELIRLGEKAIRNNIDFYYLRYRLGVAYYKTHKYGRAINNLENIFDINPEDDDLNAYLYYSFLLSGRADEAEIYFSELSESVKDKIRPANNSFINNLFTESGFGFNNDISKNESVDIDGVDDYYGEQILNGDYFYFRTGLKQIPLKRISVKYNYSYLNLKKTKVISFNDSKIHDDYSQKQNQFYNEITLNTGKGILISPAGHYVNVFDNTIYPNYDSATYIFDSLSMNYKLNEAYYTITRKDSELNNFVLSLDVSKHFEKFKAGVNGSFSFLNDKHQTQAGISFTYMPGENLNFYTVSNLVLHNQNSISNLIFTQQIGGSIINKFYYNLFFTYGKMENYNEQNGALVFNNPDITKIKFGAELNYYFPFNLNAYFVYLMQLKEKKYYEYRLTEYQSGFPLYSPVTSKLDYNTNIILLGLKYLF